MAKGSFNCEWVSGILQIGKYLNSQDTRDYRLCLSFVIMKSLDTKVMCFQPNRGRVRWMQKNKTKAYSWIQLLFWAVYFGEHLFWTVVRLQGPFLGPRPEVGLSDLVPAFPSSRGWSSQASGSYGFDGGIGLSRSLEQTWPRWGCIASFPLDLAFRWCGCLFWGAGVYSVYILLYLHLNFTIKY